MSKPKKLNVRLLRRVQKAILKHPWQFEMSWWFDNTLHLSRSTLEPKGCGTAACIAGWAVHLTSGNKKLSQTRTLHGDAYDAEDLLGLSCDQSCSLFNTGGWPSYFATAYRQATNPETRAKVAARRIEHFISTGGAE